MLEGNDKRVSKTSSKIIDAANEHRVAVDGQYGGVVSLETLLVLEKNGEQFVCPVTTKSSSLRALEMTSAGLLLNRKMIGMFKRTENNSITADVENYNKKSSIGKIIEIEMLL